MTLESLKRMTLIVRVDVMLVQYSPKSMPSLHRVDFAGARENYGMQVFGHEEEIRCPQAVLGAT